MTRNVKRSAFKKGLFSEIMDKDTREWDKSEQKGIIGTLKDADKNSESYNMTKYKQISKEIENLEKDPDIIGKNREAEVRLSENMSGERIGVRAKYEYYENLLETRDSLKKELGI
jgi:hypothetical protein